MIMSSGSSRRVCCIEWSCGVVVESHGVMFIVNFFFWLLLNVYLDFFFLFCFMSWNIHQGDRHFSYSLHYVVAPSKITESYLDLVGE